MTLRARGANDNTEPAGQQQNVQLTRRQQEILLWVAEGKTSWEISVIMRCKEVTVNYHLKGIFRRLCATNKAHAVSKAMRLGLLVPSLTGRASVPERSLRARGRGAVPGPR